MKEKQTRQIRSMEELRRKRVGRDLFSIQRDWMQNYPRASLFFPPAEKARSIRTCSFDAPIFTNSGHSRRAFARMANSGLIHAERAFERLQFQRRIKRKGGIETRNPERVDLGETIIQTTRRSRRVSFRLRGTLATIRELRRNTNAPLFAHNTNKSPLISLQSSHISARRRFVFSFHE